MTGAVLLAFIGGVLGGLLTLAASVAVAKTNAKATKETSRTAPYEQLANRVSKLEEQREEDEITINMLKDRITVIVTDRDAVVAYLRTFATWAFQGAKPPPPPVPLHLHHVLDFDDWEVASITERTTRYVHQPESGLQSPQETTITEEGTGI